MELPDTSDFEAFFDAVEPQLRRAHFAVFGLERGPEATAEAFAWAWETWPRARELESPVGYLFRVGQSRTRGRRFRPVFTPATVDDPLVEPKLGAALVELSESRPRRGSPRPRLRLDHPRGGGAPWGPSHQRPDPSRTRTAPTTCSIGGDYSCLSCQK